MQEAKTYYSGENHLYGYKVEVSELPSGLAADFAQHYARWTAIIYIFNRNFVFHRS